jgi:hypothetical protein
MKRFRTGNDVTCVKNRFYEKNLTVGNKYKVELIKGKSIFVHCDDAGSNPPNGVSGWCFLKEYFTTK